jgi:hypothetical protein
MSEDLGNFLVDLATDADRLGRFIENPEEELARTTLTPEERAAILTRDSRRIGVALRASPETAGEGIQGGKKKKGGKKRPKPKKGPRKPAKKR